MSRDVILADQVESHEGGMTDGAKRKVFRPLVSACARRAMVALVFLADTYNSQANDSSRDCDGGDDAGAVCSHDNLTKKMRQIRLVPLAPVRPLSTPADRCHTEDVGSVALNFDRTE